MELSTSKSDLPSSLRDLRRCDFLCFFLRTGDGDGDLELDEERRLGGGEGDLRDEGPSLGSPREISAVAAANSLICD